MVFHDRAERFIRIYLGKYVEEVAVDTLLLCRIIVGYAEEKVHTGRCARFRLYKFCVIFNDLFKRGIWRRTNNARICFALITKFLIHSVMKCIEPHLKRLLRRIFA
jgi:hypothetical protein